MKMMMVVVPSNSAEPVLDALINAGHTATYAETRGGMLRQSQKSLFIAIKEIQLDEVLNIIKNPRTAWQWLIQYKPSIKGTPLELLKEGQIGKVVKAAERDFG